MFGFLDIEKAGDEHLMILIAKGRKKAFELLYDRYYGKLVHFAYSQIHDRQMAEDIVQDVFIRIIEKPEAFDPGRKFSTWVYTVAMNACRNAVRNEANRNRLLNDSLHGLAVFTLPAAHQKDHAYLVTKVQELLEKVSEKERLVYLLRFVEEMSIGDIAKIAGIPEGSVKSCIYYLLKKFKGHLKDFKNA